MDIRRRQTVAPIPAHPMSNRLKFGFVGLLFVTVIGICVSRVEFSETAARTSEVISKGRLDTEAMSSFGVPPLSPGVAVKEQEEGHGPSAKVRGWTIPFGGEFWRHGRKPAEPALEVQERSSGTMPTDINLGDIIDRVSHAITTDESSVIPRVRAKTYTANFDGSGVRFSPHRPWSSELPLITPRNGGASVLASPDFPEWPTDPMDAIQRPAAAVRTSLTPSASPQPFDERTMRTGFPLPDPGTELTLRTRAVRLKDRALYERRHQSLNWSLEGNTAQTLLNNHVGLVEHCEATGEGIRVSWVLHERPAGDGPLEIQLELQGLGYAGTSDQGIHLSYGAGVPRVCIGQAVAVDSAGRRSELPMVVNGGLFCIEVSQTVLANTTFPLAIDPLISPEFGMDEPVIVSEPGFHHLPAVAWNGTNWLVVWTEWFALFDSPVDVVAARVSEEGELLDPFGIVISRENPPWASPAVASNGKDFLVVWVPDDFPDGPAVHGARVNSEGQVMDDVPIVISRSGREHLVPSVAGDSEGYLVAWQMRTDSGSDQDVYGTRVSNVGLVLDGEGVPISAAPGHQGSPSVARGPGGFLVVWSDGREWESRGADIFGTRVDRDAMVLDPDGIAISTAPEGQGFVSVAAGSNAYLVTWQDSRSTGKVSEGDIYATLVTPDGEVSHPQGIAVSTASGHQSRPSVAAGADYFLVVWKDNRAIEPGVYASRVNPAGAVLDPEGRLVDAGAVSLGPRLAPSDSGFLVVWDRTWPIGGAFGSSILGVRLNNRAEVIDAEAILITAKDNDEVSPAVASNGAGWLAVWVDWRNSTNASDIYGVRIGYDGTVLDTVTIPISIQPGFESSPSVASAGGDYLIAWTDSRNFGSNFDDIYGARVGGDGTVMDPNGIAICRAADFQFNSAVTSDGTDYFVVWQDRRDAETNATDIYGARVNRDGIVLEPDGFPISVRAKSDSETVTSFNGKEFLVVWTERNQSPGPQDDIWGARVNRAGAVLDPDAIPISRAPNAQARPAVASAGSDFLVIWRDTRNTATSGGHTFGGHIYGARVNSDGYVLDPDGFLVSTEAFGASTSVAFGGTDFLAVWSSPSAAAGSTRQFLAAWIDGGGRVLLRDLVVNTDGVSPAVPAIAPGPSNSFLMVGEGSRNGASRVFGHLVSFARIPVVQSLTFTGGAATLSWRAEAGERYRAQFRPDWNDSDWIDLEPIVTATNTEASISDPSASRDSQRYFRVFQLP